MTKEMRKNKEKYCLFCVQHRALPFCSKDEMLPGCPWADADELPEQSMEDYSDIIICACCGKEKYIPDKQLWTYKRLHHKPGNAYRVDYFCSYSCWRKEEKDREHLRKRLIVDCA